MQGVLTQIATLLVLVAGFVWNRRSARPLAA
jgi:hypothetical protein